MKSRITILVLFGIILLCMTLHGQYKIDQAGPQPSRSWSGNLQYDLSMAADTESTADSASAASKVVYKRIYSPLRAGLFSLVIPGTGQFYTKSYLKGSLHLGAEILLWVLYATYEKKGDDQTSAFQNYANDHWSVVRYANWINSPAGFQSNYRTGILIGNPPADVARPWEYVNWNELNLCEETIGEQPNTGFTHKLAPFRDQQYYEMIGKYAQFGSGWDDASVFTKNDVLTETVSNNFLKYRDMRGEANSFYNIGTTVSYIIVANHLFSALEAAWNASRQNHKIKLQGHIESRQIYGNYVEFVPTLHLEYEL